MFINFFLSLKDAKLPVTLREYLTLLEAMERGVGKFAVNDFYYLSRSCLIKDERNLDKFDRIFGKCFEGLEFGEDIFEAEIPEEWLRKIAERVMSPEEMAQVESLGGWEKLMETLRERLAEQEKRHDGGNKMIDGRHVPFRRPRLQSRRYPHWPGGGTSRQSGESLG